MMYFMISSLWKNLFINMIENAINMKYYQDVEDLKQKKTYKIIINMII